jgi:hypothetical protein
MIKSTNPESPTLKEKAIAAIKKFLARGQELPLQSNDEYVDEFVRHNRTACKKAQDFLKISTPH